MIAIAGAKGGCGKTVTTIGLTEAVARAGTPAVALDADRQLPNLHVTAGVDREPTMVQLVSSQLDAETETTGRPSRTARGEPAGEAPLRSIAQRSPRTAAAGIVPAPAPSERIDVEAALESFACDGLQSFVDCPSGAGPDVIEPLLAADGVIVVTTDDERSIAAAETTIEMARRLETTVLGAVCNRCTEVPSAVESWIGVPILGTVPEAETPLSDESTCTAYDAIVRLLQTRNATVRTPPQYDETLLPTGIDALDRRLGGGLEPGTVAALVADPASQSEQLLYGMTEPRGTLYLTTERSAANVRWAIGTTSMEAGTPTIRRVDGEDVLETATTLLENVPERTTLIVDPMDSLERTERGAYVSFLNDLKERLIETESVAVLHCLASTEPPTNRAATNHAVDAVFELQTAHTVFGTTTDHRLSVRKFRADGAFTEHIELEFRDACSMPLESGSDGE